LPPRGAAEAKALPVELPSALAELSELAPTPLHASLLRLALAGTVSKRALITRGTIASGFPSLILTGPPGVGKTALARLVFRLFSLNEVAGLKYLPLSSPGEIGVRRVGNEREPHESWLWDLPLVCLDELSIAEKPLRDAAFVYLLGERAIAVEGQAVVLRPFVIATYNPRQGAIILPEGVERRAVIADLSGLSSERYKIVDQLRAIFTRPLPQVGLDELAGRVEVDYSEEDAAFLAGLYRPILANRPEAMPTDELPLWHLWVGYKALGLAPKDAAALAIYDLALCLETRDLVCSDWQAILTAAYKGVRYKPPAPPLIELEQARRAEIEARAQQMRREVEEAKLRELQERLERETKQEALVSLVAELERELRGLPAEGVHILDKERRRRGLVLEPGWREAIEQQVRREVLRQGWEPRLRGLKRVLSRHLDEAGLAWLSEECKRLHTELESYKQHLSKSASELMETQLERARRAAVAGLPPASGPHLTTALSPSQRRRVFQPRYTREDVEAIERANEELLAPAAPPELIVDLATGRRHWLWPGGRTSPA
jgi:DNA polymerase III delta prime subunit